jgi:hypothetical protein
LVILIGVHPRQPAANLIPTSLACHASSQTDNLSAPAPHCFVSISIALRKESLLMKKLPVISLMIAVMAIAIAGNARTTGLDVPAPPAIGATIIDFTLPDADGKDHSLSYLKG